VWQPGDSAVGAPPAATPAAIDDALPEDRYLNRELSWLDFNARVLALAADPSLPLLERAKFLAIFASNLDEFYMVRVAGLKRRDEMGLSVRSADGLTPREQLARIGEQTQRIATRHAREFLDSVRPALAQEGIYIVTWADLDQAERDRLSTYFTGPDPARRRPGAPVPVCERAEPEPGCHGQGRRRSALRSSQGARQRGSLRRARQPRRCGRR
jgi:polyphosphate kinase